MKTILITGGSRGIGKACAVAFANAGYNVIITYNHSKTEALALCEKHQAITAIKADITSAADIARLAKAVVPYSPDILVNNAGVALPQKLLQEVSDEEWDTVFDTDIKSIFRITKALLPDMIRKQQGAIINISSMWGVSGASCEVCYSSAKAAVIGFTKALAKEVGPSGIRVNCVAPGVILTDMNKALDEACLQALKEETSLRTLGTPEDVAAAVVFLASDNARFITGQVLCCDGGIVQ